MSRRRVIAIARRPGSLEVRGAFYVLSAAIITLPLIFDRAVKDSFRLPKELLFNGFSIVFALVLLFVVTGRVRPDVIRSRFRRRALALTLSIMAWCSASTIASANRFLSTYTLLTIAFSVAIFWGAVIALDAKRTFAVLDIALLAPLINAVVVILQELGVWQPFTFAPGTSGRVTITGLLGNPNDVAMLLVVPAVATVVATATSQGLRRSFYGAAGLVLVAGLVASRTRTALVAYAAGVAVAMVIWARRTWLVWLAIVIVTVVAAMSMSLTLPRGLADLAHYAKERQFQVVFAERLPAFLSAIDMFRDHPITGVGPGNYKWYYMRYRTRLASHYDSAWFQGEPFNFNEAHNDHLQVLAEAGLPGYGLLLVALFMIARGPQTSSASGVVAFANRYRLPLATTMGVTMLAQFPLELAAPRFYFIFFAALVVAWAEEPRFDAQ